MKCYLCLVRTGDASRDAFAICQRCGAGVCDIHLVPVQRLPGMAGGGNRSLICSQCSYAGSSVSPCSDLGQGVRQEMKAGHSWWTWFRRKRVAVLPEPEEAIVTVERFLKQKRGQE
jgi:hypothetical protein